MKPVLHLLTGCTAVGKTEWALRWAETHDAEIVSCDSLLFYRGMDIGTAKPSSAERARIPHHLIDILEVNEQMNVNRYVALAQKAVAEITARGKRVLVTGGSGFYLKAFLAPVADDVRIPEDVRTAVGRLSLEEMIDELLRLNPDGLGTLDVANRRRVSRALERCRVSGKTLATLIKEFTARPSPFVEWTIALTQLDRAPEELARRIEGRVAAMLEAGLVEEVKTLLTLGLKENPSAARAIGYREVIAHLDDPRPDRNLAEEIAKNTRALVKKQRTWFRTQLPAHRVIAVEQVTLAGLFS